MGAGFCKANGTFGAAFRLMWFTSGANHFSLGLSFPNLALNMTRHPTSILMAALILGAFLTPVAGWIGAIFFPVLLFLSLGIALVSGSLKVIALGIGAPALYGVLLGSWIVTLVVLPAFAMLLRHRPTTLYLLCPVISGISGGLVIALDLFGKINSSAALETQLIAAGAFSGFVVGAIFGRGMMEYLRY